MWFQSVVVRTIKIYKKKREKKEEFVCCSVFEWETKNGLELNVACLSIMFSAVKPWNFVGLICLISSIILKVRSSSLKSGSSSENHAR